MASRLIAGAVGWTASVFYRVEVIGNPIPDGPVLVTANHFNALLDPLLIFRSAGRVARPMAKAPLFEQVFVGSMLRALGGLPVYRRQDDPALMHRNDETFRRAIEALHNGDAVQIFPEGRSHSEPGLVPLRTGAARIALQAEAQRDWQLGLRIVPIGINYRRKSFFRGDALVVLGEPYPIDEYRATYTNDPQEAVRELTDRIGSELHSVVLTLSEREDQELVDVADRIYAHARGIAGPREREPLAERMPRLRRFAEGLAWLRSSDPQHYAKLADNVRSYARVANLLGAREGDVPARYTVAGVLRYLIAQLPLLLLGIPLAAIGSVLWYLPYLAPKLVLRIVKPDFESIATYKLAGGMFAFPLMLAVWIAIAALLGGLRAAVVMLVIAPLLGFVALAWREHWDRIREDARLFFAVLRHPRSTHDLARLRNQLAAEFDALALRMETPAQVG